MDETHLKWTMSSVKTWSDTGFENFVTQVTKGKCQCTVTNWIDMDGGVIFFHKTTKVKIERCLPDRKLCRQAKFNNFLRMTMCRNSPNHWVSK